MKKLTLLFLFTLLFTGCAKDENNSNNDYYCDSFGCYQNYGNNNRYGNNYRFGNGYSPYNNPNAIHLEGSVQVTNNKNWKKGLDVLIDCAPKAPNWVFISTCGLYANRSNIDIRIVFDHYKFKQGQESSTGSVIVAGIAHTVRWRRITSVDGREGFEAAINGANSLPLIVHAYGRATDASLATSLFYGLPNHPQDPAHFIGQGRAYRTNLPH